MINKMRRELAVNSQNRFTEEMRALGFADKEILKELDLFLFKGGTKNGSN
ncbi:MAG: hypothetical protein FWC17_01265 [Treponema sp.]|nr:hypothetical protein [Treponema sp.]